MTEHIHLPEAVFCQKVTDGHIQIMLITCINMRNGKTVAVYLHRGMKACKGQIFVIIGNCSDGKDF